MSAIDNIEDMFYIRKQRFETDVNDGVADAFAETNPSDNSTKILPKKPKIK